jgi:hypothetical protein
MRQTTLAQLAVELMGMPVDEAPAQTIGLQEPWSAESPAVVVDLDPETCVAMEPYPEGFKYFLGSSSAREALEVFGDPPVASIDDACRLLIHYARFDAFPEWVYQDR